MIIVEHNVESEQKSMHQYARLGFRSGRSGRNTRDPKSSPLYEKFHHPAFLLLSTLLYFHLLVLTRTPFSLAGGSRDRSRTIRISSPTAGYMDKNKLGGGTRSVLASNFGRILSPSCHRSRSSHFPHPPPIRVPARALVSYLFFTFFWYFCFSVSFARNRFDYEMLVRVSMELDSRFDGAIKTL